MEGIGMIALTNRYDVADVGYNTNTKQVSFFDHFPFHVRTTSLLAEISRSTMSQI
jgi:hypothetical protein